MALRRPLGLRRWHGLVCRGLAGAGAWAPAAGAPLPEPAPARAGSAPAALPAPCSTIRGAALGTGYLPSTEEPLLSHTHLPGLCLLLPHLCLSLPCPPGAGGILRGTPAAWGQSASSAPPVSRHSCAPRWLPRQVGTACPSPLRAAGFPSLSRRGMPVVGSSSIWLWLHMAPSESRTECPRHLLPLPPSSSSFFCWPFQARASASTEPLACHCPALELVPCWDKGVWEPGVVAGRSQAWPLAMAYPAPAPHTCPGGCVSTQSPSSQVPVSTEERVALSKGNSVWESPAPATGGCAEGQPLL